MGLKPNSSYKPTHDPLRTLVLRAYLITYLLTYRPFRPCIWLCVHVVADIARHCQSSYDSSECSRFTRYSAPRWGGRFITVDDIQWSSSSNCQSSDDFTSFDQRVQFLYVLTHAPVYAFIVSMFNKRSAKWRLDVVNYKIYAYSVDVPFVEI